MCERRKVARRAQAALLRHDRVDAAIEEGQQAIDEERPAAAVTERKRVGPQQQHGPDDLARERRADAGRVAHQEVRLEATGLFGRDGRRREVAETGRHAIDHGAGVDQLLDDIARVLHPAAGHVVEPGADPEPRDGLDIRDRKIRARQDDGVGHDAEDSRLCSPPCSTS